MANNNPGYSLFRDETGWDTSALPSPYCGWSKVSTDPAVMSIHNAAQKKATLHGYAAQALLEYADEVNGSIGVVKIADGSYASEWQKPDGTSIIAHATSNGVLTAGRRDPLTGKMEALPSLGSSKTHFNDASILILYMLIEADINAKNGVTENTITHELLRTARDDFAVNGEISENVMRLVCDDLYFALSYGKIAANIKGGSISLLTDRRISSNEFSTGVVVCGNPAILTGAPAGQRAQPGATFFKDTVGSAKKLAEAYTSKLKWTKEEEALIPVFDDDTEVPAEVMTILTRFLASRDWKNPLNNPCWRGITAYGKSTGVKILACILHTPLLWMTCATTTEVEDFLSKHVPNTDHDDDGVDNILNRPLSADDSLIVVPNAVLPTYDDLMNDPVYSYEMLTGEHKEDITGAELMRAYSDACVAASKDAGKSKRSGFEEFFKWLKGMLNRLLAIFGIIAKGSQNPFKIVESDFVRALVRGYIVEVQEFSRIRDQGTLVGLNNFSDPGSVIPLVDGRHVARHKDAMVVWTDNIGLASCRKVDASVLRRFSYVIDSNEMPRDRAIRRISLNSGCKDESLINRMYDVWEKIGQYCKENDITDEGVCSLSELENWVSLTQLEGTDNIYETCRQTIVNKVSSDPSTQKEIVDGCVMLALSSAGFAAM